MKMDVRWYLNGQISLPSASKIQGVCVADDPLPDSTNGQFDETRYIRDKQMYIVQKALQTVHHLVGDCEMTVQLHQLVSSAYWVRGPGTGMQQMILNTTYTIKESSLTLISCFILLRERCAKFFCEEENTVQQLLNQVQTQWRYTCEAPEHQLENTNARQ